MNTWGMVRPLVCHQEERIGTWLTTKHNAPPKVVRVKTAIENPTIRVAPSPTKVFRDIARTVDYLNHFDAI